MALRIIPATLLLIGMYSAHAQETPGGFACQEGLDDVATLVARGWLLKNNSAPVGPGRWMQGDPNVFQAWDGAPDSYASVGADSASGAHPVVSNWLITPEIDFGPNGFNTRSFGFYTRAVPGQANRLVVRLCMEQTAVADCIAPGPASGDFGGYGLAPALLDINPDLLANGYPNAWTGEMVYPGGGLPVVGRGRIAFHYYVFDQAGAHGTTIGIDSVTMTGATACPFTEIVFTNGFD